MITSFPAMDDIDLTDLDNFAHGFPHEIFKVHRQVAPVWWHAPTVHTPDGEGFWSVATYAETRQVLDDPVTFSSEKGGHRLYGGTLIQDTPTAGVVLNMMDDPRHSRIRRLVSSGLTPRTVRHLEDELRYRATALLCRLEPGKPFDFLTEVAGELPMQMICILLGIPEEDRHPLFEAIEPAFDFRDGRETNETNPKIEAAQRFIADYALRLVADKRAQPTNDMLSAVIHASLPDLDPPTLSDAELRSFFVLLFAAGSDTTRNAIAGGLAALIERPDQLREVTANRAMIPGALEEMLRWTSPSPSKRRTATRRTQLGGHVIEAGDKVVVWEGSANRDGKVFDRPMDFDVHRQPNPHLAFGHGSHFCLGANLARLEMRILFEELLAGFGGFEMTEPIEWARSNRHTGVRHMMLQLERA